MKKIQIAVAYHKNSKLIKNDCLLPIQVGKACSDIELDMQGDDTGDNISAKNFGYAELTAIYWLWKNSDADIKGLFHYRRYLDLNQLTEHLDEDLYEYSLANDFSSSAFLSKIGISRDNIEKLLKKYTIITRRREDLHSWSTWSVKQHYAAEHHGEHLDKALDIIKQDYPEYYPSAKKLVEGHTSYFTNIFIMKSKDFNEYCSWMFDILFKIESTLNLYDKTLAPNTKKARWAGFLGERLTAIYIQKKIDDGEKIGEFPAVILTPNSNQKWYECNTYDNNLYVNQDAEKRIIINSEDSQKPIISVCIAAYNVGRFIDKCLTSVINQTLQNIEIIVVNDGSTDNTLDIIKKYAKKDQRIIIIDQKNQGLGCARNIALKKTTGKYIHFFDGDDYIAPRFLEKMVSRAEKNGADLVISTHICFDDMTGNELYRSTLPHTLIGSNLTVKSTPDLLMIPCHVWDKIYLRKLIEDFIFPDRSSGEDIPFWYQTILKAKSVTILREPLYYYRMNPNSVQTKPQNVLNCFSNMKTTEEYISKSSILTQEYFEIFKQTLIGHMMYRARIALEKNRNFRKEFYKLTKHFLQHNSIELCEDMQRKKEWFYCDFELMDKIKKCKSFKQFEKIINIRSSSQLLFDIVKYKIKLPFVSERKKAKYTTKIQNALSKLNFPVEYKLLGVKWLKFSHKNEKYTIKFLGVPLFKRNISDIYEKFYFLGLPIISRNKIKTKFLGITIKNNIDAYLIRTFDYLGWKINDVYQSNFNYIGYHLNDVLPERFDAIDKKLSELEKKDEAKI